MTYSAPHPGACLTNSRLDLILFATEKCNFRCTYCYENFGHGRMKHPVVQGVKRLLSFRSSELEHLSIAWFGGEPLLARNVIQNVMGYVRTLQSRHQQLQCSSNITTNGWLLSRPVLEQLVESGVTSFQVTFDGPRQWHDRRRLRAGGQGTFDRIWSNLLALRKSRSDFTVHIRVHVDAENQVDIPEFIDQCRAGFTGDHRYRLFIRPLSRLGGAGDSELKTLNCEENEEVFDRLRCLTEAGGLEQLKPEDTPGVCYASRTNAFVVRADGRVGKCSVALEHPSNQVGRINPDGTLTLDDGLLLPWVRGVASGKEMELRCPLKEIPGPPADKAEAQLRWADFDRALGHRLTALTEDSTVIVEGGH